MPAQSIAFSLDGSPCTIDATGQHVLDEAAVDWLAARQEYPAPGPGCRGLSAHRQAPAIETKERQ